MRRRRAHLPARRGHLETDATLEKETRSDFLRRSGIQADHAQCPGLVDRHRLQFLPSARREQRPAARRRILVSPLDPALNPSHVPGTETVSTEVLHPALDLQGALAPLDAHVGTAGHKQVDVRLPARTPLPFRRLHIRRPRQRRGGLKPVSQFGMGRRIPVEKPARLDRRERCHDAGRSNSYFPPRPAPISS